jgi:diacylglycerol diphosphate phosphatase/phosphatidate phosphatase
MECLTGPKVQACVRSPYTLDCVTVLAIFLLAGVGRLLPVYCRMFEPSDPTIAYPFANPERVPIWLVILLAGPGALLAGLIPFKGRPDRSWRVFCLVLAESLAITAATTEILKPLGGRLRPDYLARLQISNLTVADGLGCPTNTALLRDGRLSFPSGHSSTSFAAATPLAFLYAGQTGLLRPAGARVYKALASLIPLAAATYVAISRTQDYRHNFDDVLAGSLIGIFAGALAYRMHFPPLSDSSAALAYRRTTAAPVNPQDHAELSEPPA